MPMTKAINPIRSSLKKALDWSYKNPGKSVATMMAMSGGIGAFSPEMGGGKGHRVRGALIGAGSTAAMGALGAAIPYGHGGL